MDETSARDLSKINAILDLAKINRDDLSPLVQVLQFSDNICSDIKLLELNKDVEETLKLNDSVVIKGLHDDHAVLCTRNKTFEIKQAEMSDSLLILPNLNLEKFKEDNVQNIEVQKIVSMVHSYYELRPSKPWLKRLSKMLKENVYSGKECEEDQHHKGQKYTEQQLLDEVQASEEEIADELGRIKACLIEGHWRLLDFYFVSEVLNHVLNLCEEKGRTDSEFSIDMFLTELEDLYSKHIILHILNMYTDPVSSDKVKLNEDKVCRFFAELLLKQAAKFSLDDFMSVWQQSVPQGMKTDLSQIQDIALIDKDSYPCVIWYFPVDDLPESIDERFLSLFKAKKKWTLEEIKPYIRDLVKTESEVGGLLTKYCRSSVLHGTKVFNSRKPV